MTKLVLVVLVLAQQRSLSLQDCIREALQRHPEVALSEKDLELARAQKQSTRSGYLPRLDLSLEEGYDFWGKSEEMFGIEFPQPEGRDAAHGISLSLSQNIFDGGKWWKQIERANREISRTRVGMEATQEAVALRVITAFYELLKAQRQLEVLKENLGLSRAQLHLAEERKRLGAASKVDVSKAMVSLGEDRIAVESQRGVIDSSEVELNLALGRSPGDGLAIGEPAGLEIPPRPTDPATVSQSHASLRQAQAALDVARLEVEISQGGYWPKVAGNIVYSRQDPDFLKVYSKFEEIYQLTFLVTVSFPIFDGFLTSSQVEQARVRVERLGVEEKRIRQDLESSLVRATSELKRLQTIARIEAENVLAAEQQLTLANERYTVGEGTALEIRDAQLAVTRARLTEVQTQYDLRISQARYHHARGDLLATYLPEERP